MRTPFEPQWLGGHSERYFRRIRPDVDSLPWGTLDPTAYPPALLKRAQQGWTQSAFNEYRAAIAFSQLLQALLEINAPVDLVAMCSDFIADEMLHVELTCRIAMELGGGADFRIDYQGQRIAIAEGLSAVQRANELIIRVCCVGEAFSLPMLAGACRTASHPLTEGVLKRIVRDEAQHGLLGFLYLEWIEENLDETELIRLTHVATDAISALAPAWQQLRSMAATESSTESIKAHDINELGAMVYSSYLETARRALHDSVCKPLKKHGICVDPELLENLFPATETNKTLGTT